MNLVDIGIEPPVSWNPMCGMSIIICGPRVWEGPNENGDKDRAWVGIPTVGVGLNVNMGMEPIFSDENAGENGGSGRAAPESYVSRSGIPKQPILIASR